jgi:hypothetical protein
VASDKQLIPGKHIYLTDAFTLVTRLPDMRMFTVSRVSEIWDFRNDDDKYYSVFGCDDV